MRKFPPPPSLSLSLIQNEKVTVDSPSKRSFVRPRRKGLAVFMEPDERSHPSYMTRRMTFFAIGLNLLIWFIFVVFSTILDRCFCEIFIS